MTSVYDIPYKDITNFLLINGKNFNNKNDAYDKALALFKNKRSKGHTISIIEWLIAHNLLILKVDIPNYSIHEINNMSEIEINKLSKKLTMKGNNKINIINILKYLHKLEDETLLPEINNIILNNLYQLEANSINFKNLKFDDVIKILKTHRDKALVRKLIYNNIENIVLHNFLNIDIEKLDDLLYIESLLDEPYEISKSTIIKLMENNKERIIKKFTEESITHVLDFLKDTQVGLPYSIGTDKSMNRLVEFLINLIKINEIALAKQVYHIAIINNLIVVNNYKVLFIEYLIRNIINQDQENYVINKLIDFIGENDIINIYNIRNYTNTDIKKILSILIRLEKYDALIKILSFLMNINYKKTGDVISMILPGIKASIKSKEDKRIIKYIDILNLKLDKKLGSSKNYLQKVYDLIKDVEKDEH